MLGSISVRGEGGVGGIGVGVVSITAERKSHVLSRDVAEYIEQIRSLSVSVHDTPVISSGLTTEDVMYLVSKGALSLTESENVHGKREVGESTEEGYKRVTELSWINLVSLCVPI